MPRTLSADVLAEKNKENNRPVELYQIYLDEQTLYLAMYPQNIEFFDENGDPQAYTAAALSRTTIETNTDTKVDQCEVSIDNVTHEMSAYIAATEFVGRRIKIMKVFLDADRNVQSLSILGRTTWTQLVDSKEGSGLDFPENAVPIFDGIMDAPRINQYQMTVTVVSKLDTLDRKLPARTFQVPCPWQFGSEDCGFAAPEKDGTIDSLSGDYMTIYDADITEAADYWNYGEITVGTESRIITESGSGYVIVEYPFSADVEAGDSYEMKAGCDKGYDTDHGCSFWDNTDYYGGFLSIPKLKNIKEVG